MDIDNDVNKKVKKEDNIMNANTLEYRRLDFSKINKRIAGTLSTEESLNGVIPIEWSNDVLSGKKKVVISKENIVE